MEHSALPHDSVEFRRGDHVACFFSTDDERNAVVDSFMRDAISRGEKLYIVAVPTNTWNVFDNSVFTGPDNSINTLAGQLSAFDANEIFADGGEPDPEAVVSSLREEVLKALDEGYPLLRVVLDMSWAANSASQPTLSDFEFLLDQFSHRGNITVLCLYDLRGFDIESLFDALHTHGKVIVGTEACDNFYYTGLAAMSDSANPYARFHSLLSTLLECRTSCDHAPEHEQYFRHLCEAAFEGFLVHDNGKLLDISQSLARYIGYDRSEIPGLIEMNLFDFIDPAFYEKASRMIDEDSSEPYEVVGVLRNGKRVPVEICSVPGVYGGRKVQVTGIRNISDRKEAENAYRESEGRLNSIISSLHETIIAVVAQDGRITSLRAPEALVERYGLPVSAVLGRSICDFLPESEREERLERLKEVCVTGEPLRDLIAMDTPFGEFWQDITISPLRNQSGEIYAAVCVMRDVTTLHEAQEEIKRKNEELECALAVKTEFLSMVSHELRTPLVPIVGYADMLLDGSFGDIPPSFMEPIETICSRAKALDALIDDLLLLSRMERSVLKTDPQTFPVRAFLEGVAASYREMDHGKPVRVECSGEEFSVVADPMRLHQVVQNLVNNAIKYSNDSAEIEIRTCRRDNMGCISVSDHGIGIAEEHLNRIFDSFYQVEQVTTRRHEGTGLGLAIARRMVELIGGTISAQSKPGEGSTFTFTLPLASSEIDRGREVPLSGVSETGTETRRCILVVDTEEIMAGLLKENLGHRYDIVQVSSCDSVMSIVNTGRVNLLVLCSTSTQDTDILSLLTALKSNEITRDMPVVLIADHPGDDITRQALEAGEVEFIPNTSAIDEMVRRIAEIGSER